MQRFRLRERERKVREFYWTVAVLLENVLNVLRKWWARRQISLQRDNKVVLYWERVREREREGGRESDRERERPTANLSCNNTQKKKQIIHSTTQTAKTNRCNLTSDITCTRAQRATGGGSKRWLWPSSINTQTQPTSSASMFSGSLLAPASSSFCSSAGKSSKSVASVSDTKVSGPLREEVLGPAWSLT